ncbi:14707_t:CDS:2, partial [Gigaspora rosea]
AADNSIDVVYHRLGPDLVFIFACINKALEVLITEFEAKKTDEKARLEALRQSFAELEARILKLEQD